MLSEKSYFYGTRKHWQDALGAPYNFDYIPDSRGTAMEIDKSFNPTEQPRQGDLIARSNFEQRHHLDRFGVIVTADCDLERARPEHQITYLRIAPVTEYVNHVWCRKKLHDVLKKMRTDAAATFNRLLKLSAPDQLPLPPERLVEWLISSSANEVCDTLTGIDGQDSERLSATLTKLAAAVATADLDQNASALEALTTLRADEQRLTPEEMRPRIIKQATNELSRESDEVFFLSKLVSEEQSEGYYVLLDNIGTLRRDKLFNYKSEADTTEEGGHRFGRLEKTFKYAVVQRFAFLFQRIGLPDERIDLHKGALQKIS